MRVAILGADGGYAGTMRRSLAGDRVALHPARVRGGDELAVLALHGRDATEVPRAGDGDVVAAAAQIGNHVVAEARLDGERPRGESPRIERRDEVVGVPFGRIDR